MPKAMKFWTGWGFAAVVAFLLAAIGFLAWQEQHVAGDDSQPDAPLKSADAEFDGNRAYSYLQRLCQLGPRPSGSEAMRAQQNLLETFFSRRGGKVERQEFPVRHPQDGSRVELANLVVRWHPERKERFLLCAHYDTRPYPDQDPIDPRGIFLGANDGASGVAVLMELSDWVARYPGPQGIDFVLLDGEEFVFGSRDTYFLGSRYFGQQYAGGARDYHYKWGILLDMVGDKNLLIKPDAYSVRSPDIRPLVAEVWAVAERIGARQFNRERGPDVLDDHVVLHQTGGIPTCDLIDFEYPYWHTTQDVPQNCSPESLYVAGQVVREWLKSQSQQASAASALR
jgi:hypothetical protein